ncbi:hypothetical protein V491_02278 [Pseudogymnoascus sp. VKM F-3775]|nr:hypothetical protein V491_02278 [Pseudogymnoascus sp. VKM F-3775]
MRSASVLSIALLASLGLAAPSNNGPGSAASIKNLKEKVKNVVHIVMENRSFDNLVGGQTFTKDIDTPANNGPFCNKVNTTDPHSKTFCTRARDFDSIKDDPDHSVHGNNFQSYGTFHPNNEDVDSGKLVANNKGFLEQHLRSHPKLTDVDYAAREVMAYYTPDQVPVVSTLCKEFVTFDKWHSCVPGPTNPNRMCIHTGTSGGRGTNDKTFDESTVTELSLFEQLTSQNISWLNYDGTNGDFNSDAKFYNWTVATGMDKTNVRPLESFFQDAYLGKLPQYSFINPSCCGLDTNSMHPTGPISTGEVFLKQIYDAVRTSPQWDNLLLVITFDEAGGFYDHNAPPKAVRPDNLTYTEATPDGSTYTLNFNRYGGRIPTWIVSPYLPKGHVEHKGVNSAGQTDVYSATSVLRTLGYLWDFEPFTPRVEASPSFDHLFQKKRNDTPKLMPNPHVF